MHKLQTVRKKLYAQTRCYSYNTIMNKKSKKYFWVISYLVYSKLILLREGLPKKSSCSLGFCPNYLDPPLPVIWTTCTTIFNTNLPKIWTGVPPLPIAKLSQYIQFVKSGQEIWAGPSLPLIWTKSKRTATSFRETFPKATSPQRLKMILFNVQILHGYYIPHICHFFYTGKIFGE